MNFVQILACDESILSILSLVKLVVNLICWIVPIVIIVLTTFDVAKIVTAGNLDDKLKKEVTGKITSRLIYAVIIFLIPTIVTLLFNILGKQSTPIKNATENDNSITGCTWAEAWKQA